MENQSVHMFFIIRLVIYTLRPQPLISIVLIFAMIMNYAGNFISFAYFMFSINANIVKCNN